MMTKDRCARSVKWILRGGTVASYNACIWVRDVRFVQLPFTCTEDFPALEMNSLTRV